MLQIVKAVADELIKFSIEHADGSPPSVEFATDIVMLFDSCAKGAPLEDRYAAFQTVLASRWGVAVSKGTAYFVLEKAAAMVNELKKTHFV